MGKRLGGYTHPFLDGEPVFPPHLYVIAVRETMPVQVGQNEIHAHVMVKLGVGQHLHRRVFIAMHQDGRLSLGGGIPRVERVGTLPVTQHYERVPQRACPLEAVYPFLDARLLLVELGVVSGVGQPLCPEGIVQHIEAAARQDQQQYHYREKECFKYRFSHFMAKISGLQRENRKKSVFFRKKRAKNLV